MATPVRSASANALRNNALTVWPGMTIFWIGDLGHQGTVSGHNPDDYPGVRAELQDSDLIPEVRALDFMIGPKFTASDGMRLVNALVKGVDRQRLYYVIHRSTIWRRATGFQAQVYNGSDNHNSHVHTSGYVDDDANGRDWTSVLALGKEPPLTPAEIQAVAAAVWAKVINSPSLSFSAPAADWLKDAYALSHDRADGTMAILNQVKATLDKIVVQPPGGGLSELQVRDIVRQELDKTKLGG